MNGMELDLSQFEPVEAPKECVLKEKVAWAVAGNGTFQTAEVELIQGEIAQYGSLKPDYITIFFTNVSLNVTQEQFDQLVNALPRPPAGLIYRTLDDAFALEDEQFWIYDMETGAFLEASAFPQVVNNLYSCTDISEAYCQERYGKSWMVLTKDE
mgnify:FL=1